MMNRGQPRKALPSLEPIQFDPDSDDDLAIDVDTDEVIFFIITFFFTVPCNIELGLLVTFFLLYITWSLERCIIVWVLS